MGSDNLFHKRKTKNSRGLKRRRATREAYEKLLIVCEGEKTEPNYFEEARNYYSLNTVNVEVRGDCGSDPMSIVKFAKQRYREEKDKGDPFDKIYCVFDKDSHTTYEDASNALNTAKPENTYFAINSVPCFEYWLLLHFTYSAKPYTPLSGNSAGHQVLNDLKPFMPNYQKGQQGTFSNLIVELERAKKYAKKINQENRHSQTDNPSTRVHELIQALQELKK